MRGDPTNVTGSGARFPHGPPIQAAKAAWVIENVLAVTCILGFCVLAVAMVFALERIYANRQARLAHLISKYNSYEIAKRVFRREIWQGQTEAQLIDSLGAPAAVDRELPGTTKREAWKYRPRRANHYLLRIQLENGVVTEWRSER